MNVPKCSSEIRKELQISEFEMVIMLNKRVTELMHGAKPLIETKEGNFIETAIKELLAGKIKSSTSQE
jgi:DNA-directed RNA polymerase subunit K/omega